MQVSENGDYEVKMLWGWGHNPSYGIFIESAEENGPVHEQLAFLERKIGPGVWVCIFK